MWQGRVVGVIHRRTALGALALVSMAIAFTPSVAEAADRGARTGQPAGSAPVGSEQCTEQTVKVGIVSAKGCFTVSNNRYTSTGEVDVNGFKVDPSARGSDPGATVTIDKGTQHFTTGGKKVSFTAPPLNFGIVPLDFNIPAEGELHLGDYAYTHSGAVGNVATLLNIAAGLSAPVTLSDGAGEVVVSIQAKGLLSLIDKDQAIGITAEVKPDEGAVFDGAEIELSGVKIGPIELEKLEATFRTSGNWGGTVDLVFPRGGGQTFKVGGQIHFADGKFKDVGLTINGLEIPLGSGLIMDRLGGTFSLQPVALSANTEIYWGRKVTIFGREVSLFDLTGNVALGSSGQAVFLKVDANMRIIGAQIANGSIALFLGVNGGGGASANISAGIGLPSFSNDPSQPTYVGLSLGGWMGVVNGQGKYDFDGSGKIKAIGIDLLDGEITISDIGLAVCWKIIGVPGGVGGRWGQPINPFGFNNCGIEAFKEPKPFNIDSRAAGARARAAFELDNRPQVVRVKGRGGAPRFTLRRADGRRVETIPGTESRGRKGRDWAVMHSEETEETFVVLRNPRGRWTLTEEPGSPAVTKVTTAHPAPMPRNVRADVTGRGRHRTLRWSAQRLGNHKLVFEEIMPGGHRRPILTTSKARGSYRFLPHQTHFGPRRLRVRIQHGLGSRGTEIVDRYHVARPPAPVGLKAPARVRARRVGHRVIVDFSRVPGARGYEVSVVTANGRVRYVRRVGRNARRAVIPGTGRRGRMTVEVRSIGSDRFIGRRKQSAGITLVRTPIAIRSSE
jgi:hypothetical protein